MIVRVRLDFIRDTLDRDIDISYNAQGYISAVTDFTGRSVTYQHYQPGEPGGNPGDLKSVTSPSVAGTPNGNDFPGGKTTSYTYSTGFADPKLNHNLLTITDGRGNRYLRNIYAATTDPNGFTYDRIVFQEWGGHNIFLHYTQLLPSDLNRDAVMKTIVNDRVGNVIELIYDDRNRLLVKREFTGRANPNRETTPTTNRPIGKLRATDPDYFETQYFYNDDNQQALVIHPRGNSTQYIYESDLNPNADLRARANLRYKIRRFENFERRLFGGRPVVSLLPVPQPVVSVPGTPLSGRLVDYFEYDDRFSGCCGSEFVTLHRDPNGNETRHVYDEQGNRVQTIHPIPNIVDDYEYNRHGQLIAHIHPDNGLGHRRRDEFTYYRINLFPGPEVPAVAPIFGYLQTVTIDRNGFLLNTFYEYNERGIPTRITDPRGHDTQFVVNQLDQTVRRISREVDETTGTTIPDGLFLRCKQ